MVVLVRRRWRAALAGVAAVVAGLGAAELLAGFIAPTSSPVIVVGSAVIDLVPGPAKALAIALFGPADKTVLVIVISVIVATLAAAAGVLEARRPPLGRALVAIVGVVGAIAAMSRPDAGTLSVVPSVGAIVVSVLVLSWLLRRQTPESTGMTTSAGVDRRGFLRLAGITAGAGVLAIIGGRMLTAGAAATTQIRALFTLPKAAVPAPAVPAGASLRVPGITPLFTPNDRFYRVDTALQVPRLDPSDWTLTIDGMVKHEVVVPFDELIALPLEESTMTLNCVSNYVGGDLIGNATWLGYPIRKLLERAVPHPNADMVLSTSSDGFTAGTPLQAITDGRNAILAVGMNGKPLAFEHGYPVRMIVPGLYGYVSATKWVRRLTLTRFDRARAYWTDQGWSARGPVKLSSRIDVPRDGRTVNAGTVAVAGVAWLQHVGIARVQVRVDQGPWNDAELADALSADTWRQWVWRWPASHGAHTLTVRATDANGAIQTAEVADVVPDGATGLHSVRVTVA